MKSDYNLIIVGGGPAGMALGTYLTHHCPDLSFIVLERRTTDEISKQTNTGYDLSPSGTKALARLGGNAFEECLKHSHHYKQMSLKNLSGKTVLKISTDNPKQYLGLPVITIQRHNLMQSMMKNIPSKNLSFGKNIKEVSSLGLHGEKTEVLLEDGTKISGDVLLGCDGIHSTVRKAAFGDCGLHSTGALGLWSVKKYSELESIGPELQKCIDKGGEAFIQSGVGFSNFNAVCNDLFFYFISLTLPKNYTKIPPKHLIGEGKGYKHECLRMAKELNQPLLNEMLGYFSEDDIVATNLCDRDPLDDFCIGRTMLLGDAAHPFTPFLGQGASQAMVDSFVVGKLIEKYFVNGNLDYSSLMKEYSEIRLKPANDLMLMSRKLGVVQQGSTFANRMYSNVLFGALGLLPHKMAVDMVFSTDSNCNPNTLFPMTKEEEERLEDLKAYCSKDLTAE